MSTHVFHDRPLGREHLQEIARFGFDTVEIFATRSHFDYHAPEQIDELSSWLTETGLTLHSIHAPIVERFVNGTWSGVLSNAVVDEQARQRTVQEAGLALEIARRIQTGFLVLHLGVPSSQPSTGDNSREAAKRSIEEIHRLAAPLGVRIALEVIPNQLSSADSLVRLLEEELDDMDAGICFDFGHAFMMGDVVDAVETASGHLMTTHVHDNDGTLDNHLVPFDGAIDWPAALTAARKVGYEGALIFEVGATAPATIVLERTESVRRRFERILGE